MYETPDVVALIYAATSQIPRGMVSTYGDIAQALGDSRAARAVGETLAKNPTPIVVPCHRVVYADGAVGWYGGKGNNHDKKTALLEAEGLTIKDGKIEDFAALRFRDFEIPHVLEDLQKEQEEIRQRVIAEDVFEKLEYVAGLDVSYLGERAFGACAVYDWQSGELVEVKKTECTIRFPYIPTYLSYRETPVFAKLTEVPNTVYLVDGQGLLHPRAGIASHLGVVCDIPTVGAAKTPLYGQIGAAQGNRAEITVDGQLRGIELSEGSKKTYVSVGHRVSLATAEEICRRFLCRGIPLPLRTAHNEATLARKRAT